MDLIIENQRSEVLGVVDTAASVIWHRRYFTAGAFEIYAPATPDCIALLQRGHFVTREDAPEAGIIDTVKLTQDEDGTYIAASGPMLSGLLGRRCIASPAAYGSQPVETIMRGLVDANGITTEAARILPGLALGALRGYTETATAYASGNLLEFLGKLSQVSTIGFRVRKSGAALVFELYKGTDRSIAQTAVPQVIFAEAFDNLIGAEYEASDIDRVNTAMVTSAGYRLTVGNGTDASGFERCEAYAEVSPVTYTVTKDEDSYTVVDYAATMAAMRAEGETALAPGTENFTGSVMADGAMRYREDYDLGDIVTV